MPDKDSTPAADEPTTQLPTDAEASTQPQAPKRKPWRSRTAALIAAGVGIFALGGLGGFALGHAGHDDHFGDRAGRFGPQHGPMGGRMDGPMGGHHGPGGFEDRDGDQQPAPSPSTSPSASPSATTG